MFEISDLDIILRKLDTKGKIKDFIYQVFNYKIESDIIDYHVQYIEGDVILYIYEKKTTHSIYSLEFINNTSDVYMDKYYYENTFINTVYVKKCLELYEENVIEDNIIIFCKAMNTKTIREQKEILLSFLDKEIVDILYKKPNP